MGGVSIGDGLVGALHVSCMLLRSMDNKRKRAVFPDRSFLFIYYLLVFKEICHRIPAYIHSQRFIQIILYSIDLTTNRIKNELAC